VPSAPPGRRGRAILPGVASILLLGLATPATAAEIWEVVTYGNGELLTAAFRGIALFASEGLQSALKIAALVALLGALFASIPLVLGGQQALLAIPHTALAAGIVALLCTIHVPVAVVDKVALSTDIVGGVPLPVAVIGYASSAFGERLAEKVEQAIYPPDYYGKFTQSGLGWGPRVVEATMAATLVDLQLATDLDAYIRLCVIPDVQSGHAQLDTVLKATTVEAMLGGTNPAIPVLLPSQCNADGLPEGCTPPPADQRCPEAFERVLLPRLAAASQDPQVLAMIGQAIGKADPTEVLPAISTAAQDILQVSQDGVDLLKLRFAANQLLPAVQAHAALAGQSALVAAWSLSAAEAQQTASWISMGLLIQQVLPFFHATLEFLFYGFLLFGIPLIIVMPRIFPQILANALWLQLWPLAYVFANRILYGQAAKAGLYSSQMEWGLSVAASQPITDTFHYAYAASGFPVAIGVMLLGGMVFGGSYAMTKIAERGPWHMGAGMGVEAAMGNVNYGTVSTEQRNLAPHTQVMTIDEGGRPALAEMAGPVDSPMSTVIRDAGGGTETRTVVDGMAAWSKTNVEQDVLSVTPRGVAFASRDLSVGMARQEVARVAAAHETARGQSVRSGAEWAAAVSTATREMQEFGRSSTAGSDHGSAVRAGTQLGRGYTQAALAALSQTRGARDTFQQIRDLMADGRSSLGLAVVGTGIGAGMSFRVGDSEGKGREFALTGQQARNFAERFQKELSLNTEFQEGRRTMTQLAASRGRADAWEAADRAATTFSTARADEERAATALESARSLQTTITQSGGGAIALAAWEHWGYAQQYGPMLRANDPGNPEGLAGLRRFYAEFTTKIHDPDARAELGGSSRRPMPGTAAASNSRPR